MDQGEMIKQRTIYFNIMNGSNKIQMETLEENQEWLDKNKNRKCDAVMTHEERTTK